jgi:endonuclease-3
MNEKSRIKKILETLQREYSNRNYYLTFHNPLELLIASILSIQVHDEIVNSTTPTLFRKYKTITDYANVNLQELIYDIKSISFSRKKAEYIIEACKIMQREYNSEIPKNIDELTSLPGLGRKTANIILTHAFGIVQGIPCDTHCIRVSSRLHLTVNTNPDKIAYDLQDIFPLETWKHIPIFLKAHGKAVCQARKAYCSICKLTRLCPKKGVTKQI